jgi:glycosyltransferase involved in cell wall biosynthesis
MPKVTIGLPVYNGEKFLNEKIDSLLKQTFSDFEIIISDNASSDNTKIICEKYLKKDNRIKYYRQEKNIGFRSFVYILEQAKGEYFLWTAVDDKISFDFIKKNVNILDIKKNVVCSVSQVRYYGEKTDHMKIHSEDSKFSKIKKKIYWYFSPLKNIPAQGKLEKKIRLYLKIRGHHHIFYGVFRTEQLKKSMVTTAGNTFDLPTILNALKYGDFYVIDKILMLRGDEGISSGGFFNYKEKLDLKFWQTVFIYYPMTKWVFKNFGFKIFLENLDSLIIWNFEVFFHLFVDIIRKIKKGKF